MAMQIEKVSAKARELELLRRIWTEIMHYQNRAIVTRNILVENWKERYQPPKDFNSFLMNHCQSSNDFHYYFMRMMIDVAEDEDLRIDQRTLWHFTMTVKSMYRPVEYHNWAHAFSVAHFIYVILKSKEDKLSRLERISCIIAGICHDLDHRGRNNAFMVNTKSELGLLYPTSTMERHHFHVAKKILQRPECNILESLSEKDRDLTMKYIEEDILATDLARFFPNRSKLENIVSTGLFGWKFPEHSFLLRSILMTACDLCATAKSWPIQKECARKVYHEFFEQGDEEKRLGLQVLPMFDRNRSGSLADNQIGFINGIALPCFTLLEKVFPCIVPMADQIRSNRSRWERIKNGEIDENNDKEIVK